MKKYIKPSLEVKSFKVSEDIAALKEYYYQNTADQKKIALFVNRLSTGEQTL